MTYETLKRSHLKRNIIIAIVIVLVLSAIILTFTRAKYRTTQSMPLLNGTINYTLADLNIVAMYLDGSEIDTLPDGNYELTSESYCTNEENVRDESITLSYDSETKGLSVSPMTKKGTKCYLYFEEMPYTCKGSACESILANMTDFRTRNDFSTIVKETTTGTIYKSANESQYDNDGEVYYFAGNPTDNWFQFGTNSSGQALYWRIIRINGDGSVRLIYNGTSTSQTGTSTMINTSQTFNSSDNNNMYVGYMYQSGQVHGLTTNSSIKTTLDNWYLSNLADEAEYLDGNAGFCGDRTPSTSSSSSNGQGGTGTTQTFYRAYIELIDEKNPSFKCIDEEGQDRDLYTTSGSSKGNKALTQPIGLISADEVAFAGGVYNKNNSSYYLYNNAHCWTMTPFYFSGGADGSARVFVVYSGGRLYFDLGVNKAYGVRPVINIRANVSLTGSGTTSDPFKVVGAS